MSKGNPYREQAQKFAKAANKYLATFISYTRQVQEKVRNEVEHQWISFSQYPNQFATAKRARIWMSADDRHRFAKGHEFDETRLAEMRRRADVNNKQAKKRIRKNQGTLEGQLAKDTELKAASNTASEKVLSTAERSAIPIGNVWKEDAAKIYDAASAFVKKNSWVRYSLYGAAGMIAFNLASRAIYGTINRFSSPIIPSKYNHGYDVMQETITDFGSPVNLAKASQKAIAQYYSGVRNSIVTTVRSVINRNPALVSSKRAIGHMRY
jgi:hypothetical protein